MYASTSSQLFSTYQYMSSVSCGVNIRKSFLPYGRATLKNTDNPSVRISSTSIFRCGLVNLISTHQRYIEQNVRHSFITCASAIEPSGRALLVTALLYSRISLFNKLSIDITYNKNIIMNNKYYNIMQLSFNWVHPSCMYWPTQSSLMWKMNRKMHHDIKEGGREYHLELTESNDNLLLQYVNLTSFQCLRT